MRRLALFALFFIIFSPAFSLHAQTNNPEDIISSGIVISTNPELPGPNETVDARLDSSSTDLDRSIITWSVNGKKVASGRGIRSITLTSGSQGADTTIDVTIVSPDGTFNKSLTLQSASVDLLWQGATYAPPFYEGRTLWTDQARYTLLAIPHVAGRTAGNLSFKWTKDGTVLGQSSGTGQDSLILFDTILGLPQTVKVDVMTDNDTVAASATITLTPREPELHVYEDNPLYGYRFDNDASGTFTLSDKEVTFAAFPFFFGTNTRINSNIIYSWLTNNGDAQVGNEVTYRAPDSGAGSSSVTASAKSLTQILQTADKDFLVQFNTTNAF
ncbi:MAG: seg [Parcubacteria group bacterium]|nr:seg [Parcubacteria group bacterium]